MSSRSLAEVREAAAVAALVKYKLINSEEWVAWAVKRIDSCSAPPDWLVELCTTSDRTDAANYLLECGEYVRNEDELGCVWLQHECGWLTRMQVVTDGFEIVGEWDTGGGFCKQRGDLMALMQRIEQNNPLSERDRVSKYATYPSSDQVPDAVWFDTITLFAPLSRVVQKRAGMSVQTGQHPRTANP